MSGNKRRKSIRTKTGAKQAIDNLPLLNYWNGFFRLLEHTKNDNENEAKKLFQFFNNSELRRQLNRVER